MNMDLHDIEKIEVKKIKRLGNNGYVRHINFITKNTITKEKEELRITLFSDHSKTLKLDIEKSKNSYEKTQKSLKE